jgi:hypothetical protein
MTVPSLEDVLRLVRVSTHTHTQAADVPSTHTHTQADMPSTHTDTHTHTQAADVSSTHTEHVADEQAETNANQKEENEA